MPFKALSMKEFPRRALNCLSIHVVIICRLDIQFVEGLINPAAEPNGNINGRNIAIIRFVMLYNRT